MEGKKINKFKVKLKKIRGLYKKYFFFKKKRYSILNKIIKKELNICIRTILLLLFYTKKKNLNNLLISNNNIYKSLDVILKKKKNTKNHIGVKKYKNIFFKDTIWVPGNLTKRDYFYQIIKKKKVGLILILFVDIEEIDIILKELLLLKLPIVIIHNYEIFDYKNDFILYNFKIKTIYEFFTALYILKLSFLI
jgi:hypothetical protein